MSENDFDHSKLSDHQKALLDSMDDENRERFDRKPDAEKHAIMAMQTGKAPAEGDRPLLRRSPNRERSCRGAVAHLGYLQLIADLETQTGPKQLNEKTITPYFRNWLRSDVLTGYIRNASGTILEIAADAWNDDTFANCIADRKVTIAAEPRNELSELDGSTEEVDHYDNYRKLTQSNESTVVTGLPVRLQMVTGHVFFFSWDVERAFGYGWGMYEAPPSLDACEDNAEVPSDAQGDKRPLMDKQAVASEPMHINAETTAKRPRGRPANESMRYKSLLFEFFYTLNHKEEIGTDLALKKALNDHLAQAGKSGLIPSEDTQRECATEVWALIINAKDNLAIP